MQHCVSFKPYDIWYLNEVDNFERRELRIGFCPKCGKCIGELKEIRKTDGKEFIDKFEGDKLQNILKQEEYRINYTREDVFRNLRFRTTYGWVFGINDIIKKNGKIYTRQFACDFNGIKELIKEIH